MNTIEDKEGFRKVFSMANEDFEVPSDSKDRITLYTIVVLLVEYEEKNFTF